MNYFNSLRNKYFCQSREGLIYMVSEKSLLIGAHVSIVGGFAKAIERGTKIGATAIQIFTKSNRQWKATSLQESIVQDFFDAQKNSPIKIVVAHAAYLINLGSDSVATQHTSVKSLIQEIERCDTLKIPYLVLHPGSGSKEASQVCLQIAQFLEEALKATSSCKVMILLETMAGQGDSTGADFASLAQIRKHVSNKSRIGYCIDTCHIFAAGYEFETPIKYQALIKTIDKELGLKNIKLFHMNDSKKELGSHVDRHEHIGKGKIPISAFKLLMNDAHFAKVPKIVETPKETELEDDIQNIKTLKNLLKK